MTPAESREGGTMPLSDVTIVDLTQVVAGPFATMTLGDMGADVIKIEAIGRGDRAREVQPYPEYFDTVNRNKHSIALDLKSAEGQAVAKRLLADADVFIESTKPGRIEAFGLAYEDIREINPDIIYCSISGFGSDSPYQDVPAWDMLIQAMSGIMSITGEPDGPPLWSGLLSGDMAASMYTVQSILASLYARATGQIDGEWIEVPMLDAAISWLCVRAGHTFGFDEPFPRSGLYHPSVSPFGVFDCDDDAIVIAAGTGSLWRGFCEAIDRPDLVDDDRFDSIEARIRNRGDMRDIVEPIIADRSAEYWIERMRDHGVPAGPIYDTLTVWDDPHVQRHELRRVMERDERQDAQVIDHPVHFSNIATRLRLPPEELGASTDSVLRRYGYSTEEIDRLRESGVVD